MNKEILYKTSSHYLLEHCPDINEKTYFVVETDNSMEYLLMTEDLDEAMAYIMDINKENNLRK
tara:strand:- start:2118 stop:2306 length:189 start_codon:yes stop_codon:yes gene_type:complete